MHFILHVLIIYRNIYHKNFSFPNSMCLTCNSFLTLCLLNIYPPTINLLFSLLPSSSSLLTYSPPFLFLSFPDLRLHPNQCAPCNRCVVFWRMIMSKNYQNVALCELTVSICKRKFLKWDWSTRKHHSILEVLQHAP